MHFYIDIQRNNKLTTDNTFNIWVTAQYRPLTINWFYLGEKLSVNQLAINLKKSPLKALFVSDNL